MPKKSRVDLDALRSEVLDELRRSDAPLSVRDLLDRLARRQPEVAYYHARTAVDRLAAAGRITATVGPIPPGRRYRETRYAIPGTVYPARPLARGMNP